MASNHSSSSKTKSKIIRQEHLFFNQGSSDKEYIATLLELNNGSYVLETRWGRRGSANSIARNEDLKYGMAISLFTNKIDEKIKKGYISKSNGSTIGTFTLKTLKGKPTNQSGIYPQLLNAITEDEAKNLIADDNYWLQQKLDGIRMMLKKTGQDIDAINRRGLEIDIPDQLVEVARTATDDFIIDGEYVDGILHIFDITKLNGQDLTKMSYENRETNLNKIFSASSILIRPVSTAKSSVEKQYFFDNIKAANKEGVVFRKKEAVYTIGRPNKGGDVLKYKFYETCSAMVSEVNSKGRSSIALEMVRVIEPDTIDAYLYVGNCTIPPNAIMPNLGDIVEIRYLYIANIGGSLYQPVYLGVRTDLDIIDCNIKNLKIKNS